MNKRSTATHAQTSASASTSVAGTALSRSVTPERRTRRVRTALLGAVFTVALVLAGLSVLYLLSDRPGALIAAMLGSGLALTALVAVTGWYYEREHRRARQHFTEAVLELRQANTEFARARDEAQASSRGKSDFLAVMSHEIRTPMNAILGMSGLLLETELSTEQHKYATVVRSSGQSLLALINEILDYTKYEAGKLELEEVDFDLTELVEDCAEMFAANAHDKGLELVCDIDPSAPVSVRSDPARLRQILGNLLGNAIKFTNEGEVVVRVGPAEDGVARADREHPRVLIQVDDTGIGVEPGDRVRLFEAFTQADSSTQRRHGGTGLGLAIAKRLCELLGGEIGVTSAPGTGSRFWVTIPLSRGEVPADDDTPTVPSRGKSSKPGRALGQRASSNGLRGARVLIADRCATRRDMLDRLFVAWGMTCEVAATGDSALGLAHAAARRGRCHDLVVLSRQLPGASGIEVARAMACDSALHAVPRLLLASFGQIPSEDELDQLGVHACVTTPVRRGRLREMVKAILGDPRSSVNITRDLSRPIFLPEALQPNLRVLVAEDNPVNQQVVVHQLGQLGYKPDFVADGREATLAARTVPYDLILMDGHMPAVDGFAAARQIRDAESDGHRAVIVAMTADTTQQARERAVAADMDDFVTKPVQLEQLQALFAVWFPARPADELADIPTMQRGVPSVLLDELKTAPASSRPDSLRDQRVREALGTAATWSSGDDSARAASLALADDPELRAAVAVEFARDTPRQVERVRAALRASDLAALGFAAHALKGSSLAAGAGELAALCAEVEVRALAGDREEAEGLATAIPGLAAIAVREVSGDGERKE